DWQLVIGYATYQAEREQQAEALALLRAEVERSTDVAFLETTRDLFREILRPEDERQVLARLAAVARDEREAMMYRLQQAAFLERNNQVDEAIQIIDKLVADYPTNLGVVEESAQFYWRAGLLDRSIDLFKRTLARARGASRRGLALQLARRQSEAGKLADAEATLRAYYDENRLDAEVFGELARTLGAENKLAELAELYSAAFKDVRESGLGGEESRARIVELRAGMIRTLDSLGRYQEALDQHIEIINAFPEDADRLAAAIDYAEQHGLIERLTSYYEKLTKEAFKNYRWQLVLGRIYERRGNLPGATEQYRAATVNEPQRADIRFALASTLARQRRYDEAMAVLREGWALAGRDPEWLIEVARIQVQQGKRDDAARTIQQALAARKNAKAEDQLQIASQLVEWGLDAEAVRIYEQVLAALPKTLKDEIVPYDAISRYVRSLVRVEPVAQVFQKIERLRSQYNAIAQNSQDTDGYRARGIVSQIDQAMRSDFGRGVIDYASAQEAAALGSALQAATARLTLYSDREELTRYLGIARGAGLVDTEERIYIQIKDAAFRARTRFEDLRPYNELRALIAFYNRRAAFVRAAEALASEYARDPYKGQFDYQHQIAAQYRLAGDTARELEWLRAAYASASGDLATGSADWVDRYLSLLYSSSARDELRKLASTYNPRQLQL
ncbi:MAG TPA: tetratricopeptide repeat protein, partial [Blastocatellia bacterium]|nr:tetratricopeptide repeat protein [Blastocatellia bacterium]